MIRIGSLEGSEGKREKEGEERGERKRFGGRKASWKDDRAGPLAIISLATTRQMSDYCETRRLVGRFASFFSVRKITEISTVSDVKLIIAV